MDDLFVEIWFESNSLQKAGIEGRDEREDALDDVLSQRQLGEVTGGGSGTRGSNIDIEINDSRMFDQALDLIRQTLRGLNAPADTVINRYDPAKISYRVYDSSYSQG